MIPPRDAAGVAAVARILPPAAAHKLLLQAHRPHDALDIVCGAVDESLVVRHRYCRPKEASNYHKITKKHVGKTWQES